PAYFQDRRPRDALRAGDHPARPYHAAIDDKDVRGIRLGHEAAQVKQERVVGTGGVGLDLGQDRGDQIAVVDFRVQAVWRRSADAASDERDAALVVDRRLVLGQYEERRSGLVQPRVHAGSDFDTARQRQANVDAVV